MDWQIFFEPGTPVTALPNWKKPRLYLAVSSYSRNWRHSSLYPAFRFQAKIYRYLLRLQTVLGLTSVKNANPECSYIKRFLGDSFASPNTVGVLVSNPSLPPKYVIKLEFNLGEKLGYLKYTSNQLKQLEKEYTILKNIPNDLSPEILKYGDLYKGKALLMSAIEGKMVKASLPPPPNLDLFLKQLTVTSSVSTKQHPWIKKLRKLNNLQVNTLLEPLLHRNEWPVVIQHGDLAPWNLLVNHGNIKAIDWEYGCLEGFPYLDLIYYCLQVSALIYRWKPFKSFQYIKNYVYYNNSDQLTLPEVESLIKLTIYDTFQRFNCSEKSELTKWRKTILEF